MPQCTPTSTTIKKGQKSQDHLIDSEKAFDKIQHSFMIKAFKILGIEGAYLNIIKAIFEKTMANIVLNEEN
jgi:hypothetical protein